MTTLDYDELARQALLRCVSKRPWLEEYQPEIARALREVAEATVAAERARHKPTQDAAYRLLGGDWSDAAWEQLRTALQDEVKQ